MINSAQLTASLMTPLGFFGGGFLELISIKNMYVQWRNVCFISVHMWRYGYTSPAFSLDDFWTNLFDNYVCAACLHFNTGLGCVC